MPWKTGPNEALGVAAPTGTPPGIFDTVAAVPIGTIVRMVDEVQGFGEFIYLPGVASLAAGDMVAYDLNPAGATVTRATGLANSGRPVAFALAAYGAGTFGWYQIGGLAIASCVAGTAVGNCFLSATAGSVQSTAIAGAQVLGARNTTAVGTPSALKNYVTLNRPHMQGQIT